MTVRSISDQKKPEQESGRKTCREEPAEEESGRKNLPGGACRGRIRSEESAGKYLTTDAEKGQKLEESRQ